MTTKSPLALWRHHTPTPPMLDTYLNRTGFSSPNAVTTLSKKFGSQRSSMTSRIERGTRVPQALQDVFIASNQGEDVIVAPPNKVAAKFFGRVMNRTILRSVSSARRLGASPAKRRYSNNHLSQSGNGAVRNDSGDQSSSVIPTTSSFRVSVSRIFPSSGVCSEALSVASRAQESHQRVQQKVQ
jgi:hypothetical protein